MASKRKKTGFDKFFDEQMRDAKFREGYEKIRNEIDMVDALVRALDAARVDAGVSKAALARQISAEPAAVRRLFTAERANPTLATFAKLADTLGYEVQLARKAPTPRSAAKKKATKQGGGKRRSASKADADEAVAS
ncbi:MAG: helix-turn-helix domain-containing protein [Myxococcales bacterium]|nr:helix-turn-helix domain-containing protein [Myxococcales bacterium]MCB9576008.1 helix-turn-helix domain-containing protein [Polyangiaceae bacterium]